MNVKRFGVVLCLFRLLLANAVLAQESDLGNWAMYFGNIPINSKWNIHAETQYRNYNMVGDLQQFVLRGGVGYNISENNHNLLAGYAYFWHAPYVDDTEVKRNFGEHRFWQQFIARDRMGRVFFLHRYRFEQRFYDNKEQYRLRYFLSFNIPINKKTMEKNAFYASVYNEIFIKLDTPYFDRNRFYMAGGYVIGPDLRMELGWMNQLVFNRDEFSSFDRPQLQIALFHTIRFFQKD